MPELDPVRQDITADAVAYLAAMDDMIAKAMEFAEAADAAAEAAAKIGLVADDMAVMVGAAAGRVNDLRDSLAGMDAAADAAASALGDVRTRAAEVAAANGLAAASTVGLAAGADAAGTAAWTAAGFWARWGTVVHWVVAGSAELAAVLIPATVAAGAWAAVWLQGTTNVYQHIMSVYGATEAMANAGAETAGQMLGLGHALQTAQNAANPQVYQALGGAINLVRESAGGLAKVGGEVGQTFDVFMGKLVYDFSAAGRAGSTLNDLLSHMQSDLQDVGRFFGNLGAALASFASQMPGLAEVLLSVIAGLAGVLKWVVELSGEFQVFGVSILTVLMAYEEFNRWGGLIVTLLGRMGLAAGDTSAAWYTLSHAGGVLVSIVGALPMAFAGDVTGLGGLMTRVACSMDGLRAAGGRWHGSAGRIRFAVAEMTPLAGRADRRRRRRAGHPDRQGAHRKSASQQMTDSMQDAAEKASNLDVLNVVGSNLSKLQGHLSTPATSAMDKRCGQLAAPERGLRDPLRRPVHMQAAAYRRR